MCVCESELEQDAVQELVPRMAGVLKSIQCFDEVDDPVWFESRLLLMRIQSNQAM